MGMISSERVGQSVEIDSEAPGASSTISIHRVPMIEQVAERLYQHVNSKNRRSLGGKLSRAMLSSRSPR